MRRHLTWILTLILCLPIFSAAVLAQDAETVRQPAAPTVEVDASILLYPLADELREATGRLNITFFVDGEAVVSEGLQLPGHRVSSATACDGSPLSDKDAALLLAERLRQSPPHAVEILALEPAVLAAVQRRFTDGALVEVEVTFDGSIFERLSYEELAQRSAGLQSSLVDLRQTVSDLSQVSEELRGLNSVVAGFQPNTCQGYCEQDNLQCQIACNGFPACIQQCTDIYNDCLIGCQGCTGPTVRDYTVTTTLGFTFLNVNQCLYDFFFPYAPEVHALFAIDKKHTTYRETTQCDGSQSTVVLSVTYSTSNCWSSLSQSCFAPAGNAFPVCV